MPKRIRTPKPPVVPLPARLSHYFEKLTMKAEPLAHKTVFTTYDLAQTLKTKLDSVSKTLLVKTDTGHVLVVLPGNRSLDFTKLKKALRAKSVTLAKESDMVKKLKVKAGALTPFGGYHKIPVVIDRSLARAKDMVAQTGHFTVSAKVKMRDYLKYELPAIADIGKPSGKKLQVKVKSKK